VIERLTDEVKQSWGAWSYLRSAVPVVADLRGFDTSIQLDDNPPERHNVWNVIVANTHIAAGGLPVAPRASIDDGLLDVIIVLDGTPLDITRLATEFFLGDYLEDDRVIYQTARRIRVQSDPEISFVADGETITGQPYTFIVKPCALRVVVPLG
jgi:diacylglycerol kinase (ATP)